MACRAWMRYKYQAVVPSRAHHPTRSSTLKQLTPTPTSNTPTVCLVDLLLSLPADHASQNFKMQFTLASVIAIAAALTPAVSAFSVTVSHILKRASARRYSRHDHPLTCIFSSRTARPASTRTSARVVTTSVRVSTLARALHSTATKACLSASSLRPTARLVTRFSLPSKTSARRFLSPGYPCWQSKVDRMHLGKQQTLSAFRGAKEFGGNAIQHSVAVHLVS